MKIGLSAKLLLITLVFLTCILTGFGLNFYVSQKNSVILSSIRTIHVPRLQKINTISTTLPNLQDTLQSALITGDEDDLGKAKEINEKISAIVDSLIKVETNELELLTKLKQDFNQYTTKAFSIIKLALVKNMDLGELSNDIGKMQQSLLEFSSTLSQYENKTKQRFENSIKNAQGASDRNILVGVIILITSLLVTFVVALIGKTIFTSPILRLADASKELARGITPRPIPVNQNDEIGILTHEFNRMAASIEYHQKSMKFIIDQGQKISSCQNLHQLNIQVSNALDTLFELHQIKAKFYITPLTFLDSNMDSKALFVINEHGEPTDVGNEERQRVFKSQSRVLIDDPRTKDNVAIIAFPESDSEGEVKTVVEALAISIANALTAVRLQEAMALVRSKAAQIRNIFAKIPIGICLIDGNGKIVGEYSKYLETIIGPDRIRSTNLPNFLFGLDKPTESTVDSVFFSSFNEDILNFEINSHLLPSEAVTNDSHKKNIQIEWIPITDTKDKVERLMICLKDITLVKELEEIAQSRHQKLEKVDALMNISYDSYQNLQSSINSLKSQIDNLHRSSESEKQDLKLRIHTLKGEFRTLSFGDMASTLHILETNLQNEEYEKVDVKLQELMVLNEEYQAIFNQMTGVPSSRVLQ